MLIHVVNGNTTASMTTKAVRRATAVAAPGTRIVGSTPLSGPASIEGHYDAAIALPGILAAIREADAWADPPDAHVIACFDDPGLDAARCVSPALVVGICEAAIMAARSIAGSFTIVTDLAVSVGALEKLVLIYGADRTCRRIRVANVPVLALAAGTVDTHAVIEAEIRRSMTDERPEAVVLGCASLCEAADALSKNCGLPVIEGVGAAVKWAEALVSLGLTTSRAGGYARPLPKPYVGDAATHAPTGAPTPTAASLSPLNQNTP